MDGLNRKSFETNAGLILKGKGERNKMGLHVTNKELQKHIKNIGYKGCKNCKHQISSLRMCRWGEQGGDGHLHFVCPKWDKVESEE